MTLKLPNEKPRSLPRINRLINTDGNRFVIVDIGARGGVQPIWAPIAEFTQFFGFEPDQAECDKLNAITSFTQYYNTALHERDGTYKFYLAHSTKCHALLPIDLSYWSRFPNSVYNSVASEITIEAKSLDNVVAEHNISKMDFLKIDVEGSELHVLKGGQKSLNACGVLGITTEVWWYSALKGQPSFAEMDIFLRNEGFFMFDFDLARFNLNTLPAGRLQLSDTQDAPGQLKIKPTMSSTYGQVIGGDALYLRDPIYDHINGITSFQWDATRVLTLVAFLDLLNYQDFAIEILDYFRNSLLKDIEVDELIDDLVPLIGSTSAPYDQYWEMSRDIFVDEMYVPRHLSQLKETGYVPSFKRKRKPAV